MQRHGANKRRRIPFMAFRNLTKSGSNAAKTNSHETNDGPENERRD